MTTISAYPLQWPEGWKRTENYRRRQAKFTRHGDRLSVAAACNRVMEQLTLFNNRARDEALKEIGA